MLKGIFDSRRILLAPLAGVTDPVFRSICRELGADLSFTEMISAKGLMYRNGKTEQLLYLGPGENDVSVQVFGNDPEIMAAQALRIQEKMGDTLVSIDVNMGCPVRKVVSKGDGSSLMKEPRLAARIIRTMKASVSVPVTCKFRRGWDATGRYPDAVQFGLAMEDAGADAVCIHGRYATQMYRGSSDRECIANAKRALSIPVVGNGDVFCAEDAFRLYEETGCDAVMVARGAMGNPWIFRDIGMLLGGAAHVPTVPYMERIEMCRRHARELERQTGGQIRDMRRHAMKYVQGMPGAANARASFGSCDTASDFNSVLDELSGKCVEALEEGRIEESLVFGAGSVQ